MAYSSGSRPAGFSLGRPPLQPPPQIQPRNNNGDDDLPVAFQRLTLGKRRRRPRTTLRAPLPTWGQIKHLSQKAQGLVIGTGKAVTAENLFLAMCALLTVTSSSASPVSTINYTYWAYIPNPPLLEATTWGSPDLIVYTYPRLLSPPWNNLSYLSRDDGAPYNFSQTLGPDSFPICIGPQDFCIRPGWQHWLLPDKNVTGSRMRLHRITAWSLFSDYHNVTWDMELPFPVCDPFTYIGLRHKPFLWKSCVGEFGKFQGSFVNWGPFGLFANDCSEWNITICSLSNTSQMAMPVSAVTNGSRLMAWIDGGIANPRWAHRDFPAAVQTHLWKVAAALKPAYYSKGRFSGTAQSASNYTFNDIRTYNLTTCIPLPYLFLVGNFTLKASNLTCTFCKLTSCLNQTFSETSVMIVQQRTHLWLPVNMSQPWAKNPLDRVVLEVLKRLLKRSKRMLGIIVAAVLSLIAVITLATMSSIALKTAVKNKHEIEEWHKDSYRFWTEQTQIDSQLQQQIDILKQTVHWLGDKMLLLEKQITLKCHWNSSTYCITPIRYNASETDWSLIQGSLEGNVSASLLIENLQREVNLEFGKESQEDVSAEIADQIFDQLQGLNPLAMLQSLTHSAGGVGITLLLVIVILFIIYLCLIKPNREATWKLWHMMLLQKIKKKEGNVEIL